MREGKEVINGKEIRVAYFNNPMFHEDWHKAEKKELVYAHYLHHGPDYWDDELVFCEEKDREAVVEDYNANWY